MFFVGSDSNRDCCTASISWSAGNAYSAFQAGYGRYTTSSSRTFYSPTATAIAGGNAAAQGEAMTAATIETSQRSIAQLERAVIKDSTLMPGEWCEGQLPLANQGSRPKTCSIVVTAGSERRVIDVSQIPAGA
ncbi:MULTISPECIES: hypothetical protein [unclassified Bradyrhizobium]